MKKWFFECRFRELVYLIVRMFEDCDVPYTLRTNPQHTAYRFDFMCTKENADQVNRLIYLWLAHDCEVI